MRWFEVMSDIENQLIKAKSGMLGTRRCRAM
jgi:hypothetical protein